MRLATRIVNLAPSATLAIDRRAKDMAAAGIDVVNLGVGEPDFDTPRSVRAAAVAAIERGDTHYTPAGGTRALREALGDHIRRLTGAVYGPDQVMVSAGAKHSLFNALLTLVEPGDQVLVPRPYWVTYPEQVRLAGGEPVWVPTPAEDGHRLTAARLEAAWRPGVRGLLVNSPNNPTGAVMEPSEVERIAEFAERHDLWVVSDEIYDQLVYPPAVHRSLATVPSMRDRLIYVNSLSKTYAMTGWRIGYAAGPRDVIQAMEALQGQATGNPTSIAQAAALEAVKAPLPEVSAMRDTFARRRGIAWDWVSGQPLLKAQRPEGAFYLWVDTRALIGRTIAGHAIETGSDVAAAWLDEARVAVVGGAGFGEPHAVRLSIATAEDRLTEALERVGRVMAQVE
jgi:aspartate aminotransferase